MWWIACITPELSFDGIDDYLAIEVTGTDGPALTLEAWVYPEQGGAPKQNIIARRAPQQGPQAGPQGANDAFTFRLRQDWGGVLELGLGSPQGTWGTAGKTPVPRDTWSFVAMTHDRTRNEVRLYINGILDKTDHNPFPPGQGELPTWIGGDPLHGPSGRPFKGNMRDLTIWSVVRTEQEIQHDMKNPPKAGDSGVIWKK